MKDSRSLLVTLALLTSVSAAFGITVQELTQQAKDLPTVPEKDLPPLKNEPEPFQGIVNHSGLKANTWVKFPFVENPGSFGIDPQGRLYVAEANRFWLGVPDLRGANELIREDFQAVTVEDRAKLYKAYASRFPSDFFTNTADRIIRLEDRDGNGAADHRTLFSDHFDQPLDGIGFSVLAEEDAVYFTCIPNLWKMTDTDDDGVADTHEAIVEGFGVHVSFIGHDLHGIIRGPDGRLYFSVGDRAYHVTKEDGTVLAEAGRGAIFRCDSDGGNFEVFCRGLRNPQELAFDEIGNLFTFDNTGDIGDVARMVYALEGTDSGWNMAHQSAHHYKTHLDWENFHPEKSMWVEEKMFETFTEEQPQWVYPPAAHVANGPSGVTWLTGESLPADLRQKFLLANYRGPSENCTVLALGIEPKGAGYDLVSEEVLVEGVGVTDVELGYDGNIYLCDFGGGWSVNTKGAIQVLKPTATAQRASGMVTSAVMAAGFANRSLEELTAMIFSPDRRVRQSAQFELVKRGDEGESVLITIAENEKLPVVSRLHGIWGLGQIGRNEGREEEMTQRLLSIEYDVTVEKAEIRANIARTLGELGQPSSLERLMEWLVYRSPRVQSLAAVALGRVAKKGDEDVISALYFFGAELRSGNIDPVLRHACLSALDRIGTVEAALSRIESSLREERLMAVLYLRRHASEALAEFLDDEDELIRREAIGAIYETEAMDGPAGDALAALGTAVVEYSPSVQRRVVAANYRRGGEENARTLVAMAGASDLDTATREAALQGLLLWEKKIVTDPVMGTYRPLPEGERTMANLGTMIESELKALLARDLPPNLAALALNLADSSGVKLEESTLRQLVENTTLKSEVRVAALDSLVGAVKKEAAPLVSKLMKDNAPAVSAAAVRHAFALQVEGIVPIAEESVKTGPLEVARAGIVGLAGSAPEKVADFWKTRETAEIRSELWLDLYLALQTSEEESLQKLATEFAASDPTAVFGLSETGGDPARGELVFRNQGACLQCHKIGSVGGIQGPVLTKVAERLAPEKLVESLVNPNAEVAEGYGLSSITMKDGTVLMGRIAKEENGILEVVAFDGKQSQVSRTDVEMVAPPVSAMPPLGASLPPRDLRDLVGYLASLKGKNGKSGGKGSSHGKESEQEKIAK